LSASDKPTKASAGGLERLITTTIVTYLDQHPDATAALVQEALSGAYSFRQAISSGAYGDRITMFQKRPRQARAAH
jgi:hypothetical protein